MAGNKSKKAPSFEEALEELESMVETMESGQLPLEKLISSYERGATLVSHCETVLDDARKRLELITVKTKSQADHNKDKVTDKVASKDSTPKTSSDNNDEEIRLF